MIDFLDDIGDPEISITYLTYPQNSTYTSTFVVEEFLKLIGDHLASILLRDLNTSMDFRKLAGESTDDGDQSQRAIFVSIMGSDHRPIEHFLGITHIAVSKTAAAIMDITSNLLISKEIQPSYSVVWMELIPLVVNVPVCNALSNILHRMLSISITVITGFHFALHIYLKNSLHSYHVILCSFLCGNFKYSTIKKEVFNDMQRVYELTPLKVIKSCTAQWLMHGEACWRIIS